MKNKPADFIVASELVCVARGNITPELASGNYSQANEQQKLKELLDASEQHSKQQSGFGRG